MSINKQILMGHLGNDPETYHFDNGNSITKFSLATSDSWKDKTTGEKKTATEWHNIICDKKLAELAEKWLSKGDKIYLEGKTKHRSYQSDGVTKYTTEVHVRELKFITIKKSNPSNQNTAVGSGVADDDDDLPF